MYKRQKGDSVEFSRDAAIYRRRGADSLHVSRAWIEYWTFHKNANDFEYVTGSGDSIRMNFRYRSAEALSSASLAARFERAIKSSTGYDVKCSIYRGVGALRSAWGDDVPSAYIYYDLTFGSSTYIVWVKTDIIKDASFVDPLDSDGSDPDPVYNISESWSAEGVSVSDAHPLETSYSSLASHSNHEARLVETPYGTFAVIPMNDNNTSWGQIGVDFTVFKIENDGTYRAVGTYQCANHSSKPNIFYAADGLVYIMVCLLYTSIMAPISVWCSYVRMRQRAFRHLLHAAVVSPIQRISLLLRSFSTSRRDLTQIRCTCP